jgi:hypothetical protein
MNPRRRPEEEDDEEEGEVLDFGGVDPRRRATLLESEAEELRDRLDTLLAEIGRHHRLESGEQLRRYAIVTGAALLLAGTVFALLQWRRSRLG